MAIRSLAWPGSGGQEGSETSGVSPNNNPCRERPASLELTPPVSLTRWYVSDNTSMKVRRAFAPDLAWKPGGKAWPTRRSLLPG